LATLKNKLINYKLSAILIFLLLVVSFILSLYGLNEVHNWGGDFAGYIMQAQSICQGEIAEFLEANRFTIEESTYQMGPVAYPWGFPLLMAPLYAVFGLNILALKSLNIIFYIIFLIILWLGFRQYHSYFWRIILFWLFAFNPNFLHFMNNVLSDIPFLVFSTITILFLGKVTIQQRIFISNIGDQLLLGGLIALSFFIRTQGILILAALAVTQFIEILKNVNLEYEREVGKNIKLQQSIFGRFFIASHKLWIFVLPYASFLVLALLWKFVLPEGGSSHFLLLKEISLWIMIKNIHHYLIGVPVRFLTGVPSYSLQYTIYGASILLAFIGSYERRKSDYHIIIFCLIYIFLLIIWPHKQGIRFLFPLLPFYVSFVITGLIKFFEVFQGRWKIFMKIFSVSFIGIILILFLRLSAINAFENNANQRRMNEGPYLPAATELFSFISQNIEEDKTIVFFKPRVMRLFTNRNSISIEQIDKLWKGDYLCIKKGAYSHQLGENYVASLQQDNMNNLLFENKDFQLYKIKKFQK